MTLNHSNVSLRNTRKFKQPTHYSTIWPGGPTRVMLQRHLDDIPGALSLRHKRHLALVKRGTSLSIQDMPHKGWDLFVIGTKILTLA